jgi:hypothetical protein
MSEIGDDDEQVQNNATTLEEPANMYAGFEMSENNGRTNIVPRLRSAARMEQNWHYKESKFVWEMDDNVRLEALSKCGVNK